MEIKEEKQENIELTNENINLSEEKKPEEEKKEEKEVKTEEVKIEPERKEIPISEIKEHTEIDENKIDDNSKIKKGKKVDELINKPEGETDIKPESERLWVEVFEMKLLLGLEFSQNLNEVKIFPYSEEDNFIIIASDGLWEYVSNEEVKDCDGAVSKLYEISHERWIENDDYIDDISIIVVFLE